MRSGGRRCHVLKYWQHSFQILAIKPPLSPVFKHNDHAARCFSRLGMDFWSVAQYIIGIEIEGFAHGFMVATFVLEHHATLVLTIRLP